MCVNCAWSGYLAEMEDALQRGCSSAFVSSVCQWVRDNRHITPRQVEAVNNALRRFEADNREARNVL